jgi:hypothetical protein
MIAYKVVRTVPFNNFTRPYTRRNLSISTGHSWYLVEYEEGKRVTAYSDSLGIFCFSSREYAKKFMHNYLIAAEARIIRVKTVGKRIPVSVIGVRTSNLPVFYSTIRHYTQKELRSFAKTMSRNEMKWLSDKRSKYGVQVMLPPEGTVCYPAVEVSAGRPVKLKWRK